MRIGLSLGLTQPLGKGTPAVPVFPPANTLLPVITGTTSVGSVLTVSNGTWTNTPLSYTRQWLRDGAAISGATATTYTLVAGDEGKMISATVTATNADGSGSATATAVGPITAAPAIKTYPEFQTYIAAQATGGLIAWNAIGTSTGTYRIVSPTAAQAPNLGAGLMGTPWGPASANGYSRANSWVFAAAVHGFPSAVVKDAQMAASREILVTLAELSGSANVIALNRNALLSTAGTSQPDRTAMTRLDYFDPVLGPMTMNPSTGTGPTSFTWP